MKKVTKICPVCSNNFEVYHAHQDRYTTCGHKCGGIYRQKPRVVNICKKCGIEFISKKSPTKPQDHCSRKCAHIVRIRKKQEKNSDMTCKECQKVVSIPHNKFLRGKKYCSKVCQNAHWHRESLESQKAGCYLRNAWKVYEKKCYDCGNLDHRIIVVHHIDGNRKNGLITNLIPVCHNCHCIRHIEMDGNHRMPSYRGRD